MTKYFVITPEYEYQEVIIDGSGPLIPTCDVIEIEAENRRDAIKLGVREMLRKPRFEYCKGKRSDGLCPYTGVYAEECLF